MRQKILVVPKLLVPKMLIFKSLSVVQLYLALLVVLEPIYPFFCLI